MEPDNFSINAAFLPPEELWQAIEPLLPEEPPKPKGGRPREDDRKMFTAIFYVLRTGIQWKALPRTLGAPSTVHDRFQVWLQEGVFEKFWTSSLVEYDVGVGLEWMWQAIDSATVKAPLGGSATGPNPTDRSKSGTKRHMLTEGKGIALSVVVTGANRHDKTQAEALFVAMPLLPPIPTEDDPQHMSGDKGYDYPDVRCLVGTMGYYDHIKSRGDEEQERKLIPGYRARRWVVERTHSWLNRFRRLLIRWEKKVENYVAMIHLAFAFITFRAAGIFTSG
jgi:putative transposase